MKRRSLFGLLHVGVLMPVPALAAWLSGQPLIFPSLGPSAFTLSFGQKRPDARSVIGGHFIGAICGWWITYLIIAHGLTLSDLSPPLSMDGLRIAASGVISIAFIAGMMMLFKAIHSPACATTLIVSLG